MSKKKITRFPKGKKPKYPTQLLSEVGELWEDKYIIGYQSLMDLDTMEVSDEVRDMVDKYGAVLYSVNDLGEVQRFYDSEEEYLDCIKHLEEDHE